ncbi:hypothetical protein [Argonema galeatum]|uniref:hypothetical protein n=1 Tax=Argonema galeatum TaxID=2942762 RepID=UPI002013A16F|nr:hypothetical protein [Argonema galeatum]MCL1468094.1 hypothetical protein [Argonema galeatum A003/A1]
MSELSKQKSDYEMPDDYSEILDGYDLSKAVRGKYSQRYLKDKQKSIVKITSEDGDRYVTMKTIKAKAIVTDDGKLTAEVESDMKPGEYRVTLIIEERSQGRRTS